MEPISISFAIGRSYVPYLGVAIASILKNSDPGEEIHVYVISDGIPADAKRRLSSLESIRKFKIEFLDSSLDEIGRLPSSVQPHISTDTFHRLRIASLKPDLEKCIFLDADLVVNQSLAELWELPMEPYYLAAVVDPCGIAEGWSEKFGLKDGFPYVNTGVCLFNLEKWREEDAESRLFEAVSRLGDRKGYPDQDALNLTFSPDILLLPERWNFMPLQGEPAGDQPGIGQEQVAILHWAGAHKPWEDPDLEYADVFWNYARETPFYESILFQVIRSLGEKLTDTAETAQATEADLALEREKLGQLKFRVSRAEKEIRQLIRESLESVDAVILAQYLRYKGWEVLASLSWGERRMRLKGKRDEAKTKLKRLRKRKMALVEPNS